MDVLKQYALSLIGMSLLTGIIMALAGEKPMVRQICGIVLTLVVIAPLTNFSMDAVLEGFLPDGSQSHHTDKGQQMAKEAMSDIINQKASAYILDKAKALGAQIEISLTLEGEPYPVPAAARITGKISPGDRRVLERELVESLGIPKEALDWTG